MPVNECIPYFEPADRITGRCSAAVRGKRAVVISASPPGGAAGTENARVAESGAGAAVYAVSCYDGAINEEIPLIRGNSIIPMTAGAHPLTAGTPVMSDAQGRVVTWTTGNHRVGTLYEDTTAVDADVAVALNL